MCIERRLNMFLYFKSDADTAFAVMRSGFIYLKDHCQDAYSGIELSKKEVEPQKGEMVLTLLVNDGVIGVVYNDNDENDSVKMGLSSLMNPSITSICEVKWFKPLTQGKVLKEFNQGRKETNFKC